MKSRTLPALLAFCLVFTQVTGNAHVLSHFSSDAPAKERLAHASQCAKCINFDKLGLIEPSLLSIDPPAAVLSQPYRNAAIDVGTPSDLPFHARAPPHSR
jgi:hypothetical protein